MQPIRILDASLNRAREALRVMEDAARFALNDGELAVALKEARHELRVIAGSCVPDMGILDAWRDTPGDVGTAYSTPGEERRATIRDVVTAAGKRAGEALRAIEEFAKIGGGNGRPEKELGDAAVRAKQLRYRVYELGRRLNLAFGSGAARQWRLCVLVTESLCNGRGVETTAAAALRGGADMIQLREKSLADRELLARARRLGALCREHGACFVVNDRPDIAMLAGADGIHLGQDDLSVLDARRLAGCALLVGVSTTNMDQAHRAVRDGADYCGCGPMFPTTTKHKPVIAGPAYLREYLRSEHTARTPHLAIGGIQAGNVHELAAAGCRGVAASSAVCAARDPEGVCREIVVAMEAQVARGA